MAQILVATFFFALAWGVMTGSFIIPNLILGFLLSSFALWLIREQHGQRGLLTRFFRFSRLGVLFVYELIKSSVRVAILAFSPLDRIRPGTIAFPLTAETDLEITTLANLVTLTPGTLSVDVSDDRKYLFIHGIDVSDIEETKRDIAEGFEKRIIEAFR